MRWLFILAILSAGCRPEPGTSYYDDQERFRFDAGTPGAEQRVPTLPMAVDDWFGPSGYMGDGEDGLVDASACTERAPDAMGRCHRFTWTRGSKGWAGVFWQHPDGNWGTGEGLEMPTGATAVTFSAWGETGTEVVTFGTGMGDVDGFGLELPAATLSTSPTRYRIDLSEVAYGRVVGGFVWTSSGQADETTFYVDDIRWVGEDSTE